MAEGGKCQRCGQELPAGASPGLCPRCLGSRQGGDEVQQSPPGGQRRVENDRNLLFGILAVQLRRVTPAQLVDVAAAWAADPSRDLPTRLVETGILSEKDRDLIVGFVDQAIQAHGGDTKATLSAFGGEEQVHQSFCGSIVRTESGGIRSTTPTAVALEEIDPDSVPGVHEPPGRYTLVREHAHGGMGRILLVHDQHLGRDIALKELLPAPSPPTPDGRPSPVRLSVPWIARFLQEARIAGQLEHPAIVPVYEVGHRRDGTLYYTMKLVRGQTLSQALKETSSLRERLELLPHFVDLCQAIAYAHSRGVIHRDIKPGNIMVGEFGETVVIDWGLAKARGRKDIHADEMAETIQAMRLGDEAAVSKTAYGEAIGTPAYMPPEQALGDMDAVEERSDVYSLGSVLYEILTGKPPFSGSSVREILSKVIEANPEPLKSAQADTPPELAAICIRAMQKDPARRYSSAQDLAEEVQRFLSGALVQAYQYRFSEHLRRFVTRHKAILATAAAALLTLMGVGIYSYLNIMEARDLERQQRLQAERARNQAEDARSRAEDARHAAEAEVYNITMLLVARQIEVGNYKLAEKTLWRTPKGLRNWEWGYYLGLLNRDLYTLEGERCPVLSPDGCRFVTTSGNRCRIWDTETGELLTTFEGHTEDVAWATWSRDGTLILSAADHRCPVCADASRGPGLITGPEHKSVIVWDAGTGKEVSAFCCLISSPRPAVSPNGRWLAGSFSYLEKGNRATVWDISTGREIANFCPGETSLYSLVFSPDGARILTASGDPAVQVWDSATGEELLVLPGHSGGFGDVSFSPDGTRILTISPEGAATLSSAITGQPVWSEAKDLDLAGKTVLAVFSPAGREIATGCRTGVVNLWEIATPDDRPFFQASPDPSFLGTVVPQAAFSPSGSRLLTFQQPGMVNVWDVATRSKWTSVEGIVSPGFTPDETRLVLDTVGFGVKVWDARRPQEVISRIPQEMLRPNYLDSDAIDELGFDSEGKRVLLFWSSRSAIFWDIPEDKRLVIAADPDMWVPPAISPGGKRLFEPACGSIVWDTENGEIAAHVPALLPSSLHSVAFDNTAKRLLWVDGEGPGKVFDAISGRDLVTLEDTVAGLREALFAPNGGRVAIRNFSQVTLYDTLTGGRIAAFPEEGPRNAGEIYTSPYPTCAAFSADSAHVAVGFRDGTIGIYDASTGVTVTKLTAYSSEIRNVAFSPNGRWLATCSFVASAKVFDVKTGELVGSFEGHAGVVESVSFSPDSKRLVTASSDKTAKVWDVVMGRELATSAGHAQSVYRAMFSADGARILTASHDGTARVWSSAPWRIEDLPGDDAMSWEERFKLYKRNRLWEYNGRLRERREVIDTVVTTREAVEQAFRRLLACSDERDLADKADLAGPHRGFAIRDGARFEALSQLAFERDDLITRINGSEVTDAETAHGAICAFLEALEAEERPSLTVQLVRWGRFWEMRFKLHDVLVMEREIVLPKALVATWYPRALAVLVRDREQIERKYQEVARYVGKRHDELPGMRLFALRSFLRDLGAEEALWPYVKEAVLPEAQMVLSVNGVPLNSVDTLLKVLHGVQKDVETMDVPTARVIVQRSPFERVEYTLIVR